MHRINIFDKNFIPLGTESSTDWKAPKNFKYEKCLREFDGITIFTDHCYDEVDHVNSKIKVAWQVESPIFSDYDFYNMLDKHEHKFDLIITYDKNLAQKNPSKFVRGHFGGTTVTNPRTYPKTKDICIVHSGKQFSENHTLRQRVIDEIPRVDSYGRGTPRPFDKIEDIYAEYRFVVVIENVDNPWYFSEKFTDAIACGCVPIYKGSHESANEFFNDSGFILWDNFNQLQSIINAMQFDEDAYNRFNVAQNLETIKRDFNTTEDWLFERYFSALI